MSDETMLKGDAATVVRVLLRIQQQIERSEYDDAIAMSRTLGQLQYRIFGTAWDDYRPPEE